MENMSFIQIGLLNLAAIIGFMFSLWLFSLLKKDVSIVDIFWGTGFVLIAWSTFFLSDGYEPRRFLVAAMTTLWGLRLSIHLFVRKQGREEDHRYQAMRADHGERFWFVSLFTVFLLQGVILWIVSLVIQAAQNIQVPSQLTWLDVLGILVFITGFVFESIADKQLARFQSDPSNKGKVMDQGLWAYSRHPNYFGETLIWWGFYAIALSHPGNFWVIVSPMLITFLLLRVSGVTLLEKTITERRPGYVDYMKRTNAFLPWFPKKEDS